MPTRRAIVDQEGKQGYRPRRHWVMVIQHKRKALQSDGSHTSLWPIPPVKSPWRPSHGLYLDVTRKVARRREGCHRPTDICPAGLGGYWHGDIHSVAWGPQSMDLGETEGASGPRVLGGFIYRETLVLRGKQDLSGAPVPRKAITNYHELAY